MGPHRAAPRHFPSAPVPGAGGGATPACVAGLVLLTASNSTEGALRLGWNAYLAQHGQPVDGSGQLGPADLQSVLEVRHW